MVRMLPNEVFALQCRDRYAEDGLVVDKSNGEFAHCPLPEGLGDSGYYLLWEDHQWQGLLQSRDVGRRCYYTGHVKKWLMSANFVEGYFDLWDIYDEFVSGEHNPRFGKPGTMTGRTHSDKTKRQYSEDRSGVKNHNFGKSGALSHHSRAVIATNLEGVELCYGGVCEATRELKCSRTAIQRCLKTSKMVTRGKFEGWKFKYV